MSNGSLSAEEVVPTTMTTLESALILIDRGLATTDEIRRAEQWRRRHSPRIGKLAMICRKLTMAQVFEVLGRQAIHGGLFGEVALELGYLDRSDVYDLLERQKQLTPSLSDALVSLGTLTPEQATSLTTDLFPVPK